MRRLRKSEAVGLDALAGGQSQGDELARLEYVALSAVMENRVADINRNYAWVLATTALVLTSQVLGLQWDSLGEFVKGQPWVLAIGALAALWFPAYDASMWSDLRMAGTYITEVLETRLGDGKDAQRSEGSPLGWNRARGRYLNDARVVMFPVWTIRMSLPYLPTLIVGGTAIPVTAAAGASAWWVWLLLAVWALALVWLGVSIRKQAVMLPMRSRT